MKILFVFFLIFCSTLSHANGIKLGVKRGNYPFLVIENQKIVGIVPEITRLLFKKLGVSIQLILMNDERINSAIKYGVFVDGVVGEEFDSFDAELKYVSQTEKLISQKKIVAGKRLSSTKIKTSKDLKGKKIGSLKREHVNRLLGTITTKIDLKEFIEVQNIHSLISLVEEDKVDYILVDEAELNSELNNISNDSIKCCKKIILSEENPITISLINKRLGRIGTNLQQKINALLNNTLVKKEIDQIIQKYP